MFLFKFQDVSRLNYFWESHDGDEEDDYQGMYPNLRCCCCPALVAVVVVAIVLWRALLLWVLVWLAVTSWCNLLRLLHCGKLCYYCG